MKFRFCRGILDISGQELLSGWVVSQETDFYHLQCTSFGRRRGNWLNVGCKLKQTIVGYSSKQIKKKSQKFDP